MNRYSYIAILVAVLVGGSLSYLFMANTSNKAQLELLKKYELKLKQQEDSSKRIIYNLDKKILELDNKIKLDSVKINSLLFKIQQDRVRMEQRREEASKFTPNEVKDWILSRYN